MNGHTDFQYAETRAQLWHDMATTNDDNPSCISLAL